MIQSLARRWFLLGFLLVSGCCAAGDNLYICLASPSEFAVDAAADAQGMTDASFELGADLPNMDDHQLVDMPDMGMPTVDVIDVPVVAQDTLIEDVSDAMSADLVDASDVPGVVDVPVLMDVATIDRFDAGTIDAPDVVLIDMPDVPALVDVGFDRPVVDTGTDVQMVDTVDAPAPVDVPVVIDRPDVPPPPELVIEYNSFGSVPSGGIFTQFAYFYSGLVGGLTQCPAVRFTQGGSNWWFRCTLERMPVSVRSVRSILLTAFGACGQAPSLACPSNWQDYFTVIWRGHIYHANDMIATEAGMVPAIQFRSRDYCSLYGYEAGCVEFTIP